MSAWQRLLSRLRGAGGRRQRMQDFDRELDSHLELEAEEQRESGLPA